MEVVRTRSAMAALADGWQAGGAPVVLVPTMGYLHDGHMALVARARQIAARRGGKVVVSIFVNPTQFGPTEDLATYPRDEARDLAMLRAAGVEAVFAPDAGGMYDPGAETIVEAQRLSRILIGRLRPGHFRGVATVVTKLFNITRARVAVFGEKDYQQLALIRRMVADLDMPVDVVGVPTQRDADGLALSSRNVRLSLEDRAAAPVIARALAAAEPLARDGTGAATILRRVRAILAKEPRADVRSLDLRDAASLAPLRGPLRAPGVILATVRFGSVALIDNRVLPPADPEQEADP